MARWVRSVRRWEAHQYNSASEYLHGYPAREQSQQSHYISFSGAIRVQATFQDLSSPSVLTLDAMMRKIATNLRFLSRDRGIYAPLVHGIPSRSYSTMSHPAPTPAPEPVSPVIRKDDTVSIDSSVVSPRTDDEPIVTRKELWSYYRKSCFRRHVSQAYSILSFPVYYNGDNVRAYYPALC